MNHIKWASPIRKTAKSDFQDQRKERDRKLLLTEHWIAVFDKNKNKKKQTVFYSLYNWGHTRHGALQKSGQLCGVDPLLSYLGSADETKVSLSCVTITFLHSTPPRWLKSCPLNNFKA